MSTTDRVELTEGERAQMNCDCAKPYDWDDHVDSCSVPAVESIVAARVQALTAERDQWKFRASVRSDLAPTYLEERDAARAELAAANARCADYENGISWGTSCISCAKTLDSSYAEYVRAERLQATLDRVTALLPKWEEAIGQRVSLYPERNMHGTCDACAEWKLLVASYPTPESDPWLCQECDDEARREINGLRAALTPEGKPR